MKNNLLKRLFATLVVLLTAFCFLGFMSPVVHARQSNLQMPSTSKVCTQGKQVTLWCLTVNGKDYDIASIDVTGFIVPNPAQGLPDPACNYSAAIRINAYGVRDYQTYNPSSGNCTRTYGQLVVPVNASFIDSPDNVYVCAKYFVGGEQQGNEKCIKLTLSLI